MFRSGLLTPHAVSVRSPFHRATSTVRVLRPAFRTQRATYSPAGVLVQSQACFDREYSKFKSTRGHGSLQVRWHSHGSGHGHSHGGLSALDEEQEEAERLQGEDAKAADRITWIGVYINVVLSAAKGVAGVSFHSSGLLADAVHSMSDLVSDGITLLALKYCARPPDQFQPYGYGKYETIGALSVATLLVGGSLGIINHSFDSLMLLVEPNATGFAAFDAKLASLAVDPEVMEAVRSMYPVIHDEAHGHPHARMVLHPAALAIAAVSVGAKEALYRATITVGKRINSSVLIANAWHHRSDAVTSVVAMAGIGLSLAGFPMFDPIAGMLVGGIILKMGGEIGWDAIKDLCDAQLPEKTVNKLRDAVQSVVEESAGEIAGVRQMRSRKIGRRVHVDLTLVLNENTLNASSPMTFERACEWKQRVKVAIQRQVPRVKDIVVELATPTQQTTTIFEDAAWGGHNHDEAMASCGQGHGHSHGQSHVHSDDQEHTSAPSAR